MILEVKNLSFHYHRGPTVFHDVSFSLEQGDVLSILGTNGAGKSTLLNCVAGLFRPASGEIYVKGRAMSGMSIREAAQVIGYVPQIHTPAYAYTVEEFTVMGRTPYIGTFSRPSRSDYALARKALDRMGVLHLKDKPYTEISGGERQQVTIARVLTQQAQILLMDEPTAHLDYGNQYRMVEMVRELAEEGYTVVITTHNPDHAILMGGKTAILDRRGELSAGRTGDVLTDETLSRLYEISIRTPYDENAGRRVCVVCGEMQQKEKGRPI